MIVVTNRRFDGEKFGHRFNTLGPMHLRIADVYERHGDWQTTVYPEEVEGKRASEWMFLHLQRRMREECKDLLIYVHGFKTDPADVYARMVKLERMFGVICVAFSWPSNGDVLDYYDDKDEARLSGPALARMLAKIGEYMAIYDKPEMVCHRRISLAVHSMGAWVLQQAVYSEVCGGVPWLDNVILVQPDVNYDGHREWVEKLNPRGNVYITQNEHDYALDLSQRKPGGLQRARLGKVVRREGKAANAIYVDFTGVKPKDGHSFFGDAESINQGCVQPVLFDLFHGQRLDENTVVLDPRTNVLRVRRDRPAKGTAA
ncbi:MAG TPA: alpha/beta hydrolase [Nevskiales bacterium]|nr:alpha/beta hydrolase [Nevskiales bacterium]